MLSEYWDVQSKTGNDKIAITLSRLERLFSDNCRSTAPFEVNVDLTNVCTQHCVHCFQMSNSTTQFIDLNSIEQIANINPLVVVLSGGEPMLHPHFYTIIEILKSSGISIKILTSGVLINDNSIKRLINAGFHKTDIIQISLDAANSLQYRQFRGADDFNACIAAMRTITSAGLTLKVHSIGTKQNERNLSDIYRLAKDAGAQYFSGAALAPIGRATVNLCARAEELIRQEILISHMCEDDGVIYCGGISGEVSQCLVIDNIVANIPAGIKRPQIYRCSACSVSCYVSPASDVYPCVFAAHDALHMGNLYTQSLDNIWKKHIESEFCSVTYRDTKCENCPHLGLCWGGCIGIGYAHTGALRPGADPRCHIVK